MACGLFGKIPSKRDFVSYNMERPFLSMWENWLQTGVAASRESLGETWQQLFLSAPIWRFWLGAAIGGTSVTGALMPSVDQVGRYFPLSLCAQAPPDHRFPPPPDAALDAWHAAAEQFLLAMLADELPQEPSLMLESFAMPTTVKNARGKTPLDARIYETPAGGDLARVMAELATEDHAAIYGERSYWWTFGGPQYSPQLLITVGMPDISDFALLMGGAPSMSLAS